MRPYCAPDAHGGHQQHLAHRRQQRQRPHAHARRLDREDLRVERVALLQLPQHLRPERVVAAAHVPQAQHQRRFHGFPPRLPEVQASTPAMNGG